MYRGVGAARTRRSAACSAIVAAQAQLLQIQLLGAMTGNFRVADNPRSRQLPRTPIDRVRATRMKRAA